MMATSAETAWTQGRFDSRHGPRKLLFGHMYEDAAIEQALFPRGARVFSIASAGCTAMALAPRCDVVAVDINPVQLDYAQRRCAGGSSVRGSAERVMAFLHRVAPLAGWSASRMRAFLYLVDPAEQLRYWRRHLDTRRFRLALAGVLSIPALGAVYAPRFLGLLPRRLGTVMRARLERCFARHPNRTNPYAPALLAGRWADPPPSPAAASIRFVQADAADYLENAPRGSFDGFTLSNILDGAAPDYSRRLFQAVRHAASPGAMVVLRSFAEPPGEVATNRAADDRAMIWGIVDVRPAAGLPIESNHAC